MLADAFVPGRGLLHAMDSRAKTVLLVAAAVLSLVPTDLWTIVCLAVVVSAVSAVALGLRETLRPLRATIPLLVLLALLTPPFYPQGEVLLRVGRVRLLTDRGLEETIRLVCRLVTLAVAFTAYFRSTELGVLLQTGRWFGLPFSACLVIGVAVRLVPSIAGLYLGVLDAHSLRRPAGPRRRGGPVSEIRRIAPAVTAVLVHSVKSIPVLTMALETRGVGRTNARTSTVELGPARAMLLHLIVGAALLAIPVLLGLLV